MIQTDRRCCCEYPGFGREDRRRTAERERQSWRQQAADDDIWVNLVGNSQDGEEVEEVKRWGRQVGGGNGIWFVDWGV